MKANAIRHGFARLSRRLAVREGGKDVERYAYDAAGRLVREGDRAYRYGYLDKVLAVTGGGRTLAYAYHPDGQLARADYGGGRTEDFEWDGLALVRRGDERFVNEPHPGGGNPVASSKGVAYLNDALGTTVGARRGARYSAAALTAFGEGGGRHAFFTDKPLVEGLGRAFLMRNYRADLAKWQTADPLGYPDGWNQLAYCGNRVTDAVDLWGCYRVGDLRADSRFPNLTDEVVSFGIIGFNAQYDDGIGYDSEYILIGKDLHKEWKWMSHKAHQDPIEVRGDKYDSLWWRYCFVSVTCENETLISKLLGYTGTLGEIGGDLSIVLKSHPLYDAALTVMAFIGQLEDCAKDSVVVGLGYVWRLESIKECWENCREYLRGCIERPE